MDFTKTIIPLALKASESIAHGEMTPSTWGSFRNEIRSPSQIIFPFLLSPPPTPPSNWIEINKLPGEVNRGFTVVDESL